MKKAIVRFISKSCPFLLLTFVCSVFLHSDSDAAYLPFSSDSAIPLIKRIIERKLPFSMERSGFTMTVRQIKRLEMNWKSSEFELECAFDLSHTDEFVMKGSGTASIRGTALFSSEENVLGVRLSGIDSLNVRGIASSINRSLATTMSRSVRGREFWAGTAPASSEILTKDNFSTMFRVALERKLPFTFKTKNSATTFIHLLHIDSYRPGKFFARVYLKGSRKGFIDLNYQGTASVDLDLFIDSENMNGYVKIGKIKKLELEKRNAISQGIIGMIIRSRMEGETIRFPLYRKK